MHMSESTLSRYESGKIEPTVEIMKQFSDFYGAPVHELTDGKEPVLKSEIMKENIIDAFFESKHGQYIFYMIIMALSAMTMTTGFGICFAVCGLYYAWKKKFPKIIIIMTCIYIFWLVTNILFFLFDFQVLPAKTGYIEM